MEFQTLNNLETELHEPPQVLFEDYDSTCSTPYVSAPSSPDREPGPGWIHGGLFYSAPASPIHFTMTSLASKVSSTRPSSPDNSPLPLGSEFEFSARFGYTGSDQTRSMTSADELFLNGKIRPLKLSTHLERPQVLAPLLDVEHEDDDGSEDVRGRDVKVRVDKRRARSMSPLRNATFGLKIHDQNMCLDKDLGHKTDSNDNETISDPMSASSSSSSSSSSDGRRSKRWVFLKGFIRSKSEGRSNNIKLWSTISFSPLKEKKAGNKSNAVVQEPNHRPVNGIGKRRVPPSPHELHYTANRAQAEEMRKKTFLPYRQGLLGCLGFSSKGYGAMNGLATALNPVSSR
ncbi:hypothetical protein ERO13_D13G114700v2 [Gossypium hirsutum]|uniref:Uncharacterized protein n=1 Tax=Gossypium hirsutum TaxID=3635 RepID=A0A1U8KNI2_GOSHI|nr:uncharacterized protein LOC107918996 [Gossypium hirsutum]KAG4111630.1 hypothetical protein ERO13_D13G114700v2 [Gossypium hirsutum]